MSGGGKGDKKSSQIKLPPEIEALAKRNLGAAERAGQIGYVPFQGPTVAALNPMQVGSMRSNYAQMQAFGVPGAVRPADAIPKAKTYAGGVRGYDPLALYAQAISKINPAQRAAIGSFVDPSIRPSVMANTPRGISTAKVPAKRAGGGTATSTAAKKAADEAAKRNRARAFIGK